MASRQRARSTEFETPSGLAAVAEKEGITLDCGPNGVMVGVTSKSGSWVDALGLICQEVNRNGSLGEDYTRRAGGRFRRHRPYQPGVLNGRVVGGFQVLDQGSFVNKIILFCPSLGCMRRKQPKNFTSTEGYLRALHRPHMYRDGSPRTYRRSVLAVLKQ